MAPAAEAVASETAELLLAEMEELVVLLLFRAAASSTSVDLRLPSLRAMGARAERPLVASAQAELAEPEEMAAMPIVT
jgi:hypothetical protein